MMKKIMTCIALLLFSLPTYAVVIGNWEGSDDGWIDWQEGQTSISDPSLMPSKYDYATVGVTNGSQSLRMSDQGWAQSLSIKLSATQRAQFMASSIFSIDYSVAADTLGVGGFARIQGMVFNCDGMTWSEGEIDLGETENYWFWGGSPERTQTLEYDYSALKALINPNPNWIEIVLVTNGQRDTDPASAYELYFDNAQLLVPEPATLSLLGLGGLLALRKRK